MAATAVVSGITTERLRGVESTRRVPVIALTANAMPGEAQKAQDAGFDEFVTAVRRKTGSTTVFSATVYPRYAVVEVPIDDEGILDLDALDAALREPEHPSSAGTSAPRTPLASTCQVTRMTARWRPTTARRSGRPGAARAGRGRAGSWRRAGRRG